MSAPTARERLVDLAEKYAGDDWCGNDVELLLSMLRRALDALENMDEWNDYAARSAMADINALAARGGTGGT